MSDLAPILIASPVRRSGTTLLQRLLCSADNALIYGESCANELHILHNLMLSRQLYFNASKDFRDEQLQRVLAGDVNDWIADLMPDITSYLQALKERYLSIFKYYQSFAAEKGRPIWGMKMAEWMAPQLQQAFELFPKAKLLYIHRPLTGCVRSAKRVNMITHGQELQRFCQTWQQNLTFVQQQLPANQVLFVDYDALVKNAPPIIEAIEAFTGAQNIQVSVMEHRINTYVNNTSTDPSGKGYMPPAELSGEDQRIIEAFELKV